MTTTIGQQRMFPRNMLLKTFKDESAKKQHKQAIRDAVADMNRRRKASNSNTRIVSEEGCDSSPSQRSVKDASKEEDTAAGLKYI